MSLMGRTLERILRKAPTRVLLVRERDDYLGASGFASTRRSGQ